MKSTACLVGVVFPIALLTGCNSDVPVTASLQIPNEGTLTVTRTATHPFLARFSLMLTMQGQGTCRAETELFPDTGYVSRRNLYRVEERLYYLIGQYDARVINFEDCRVILSEFHSLKTQITFLGSFDLDEGKQWSYLAADQRAERPFERR